MRTIQAAYRFALFATSTFGLYAIWFVLNPFIPNKIYWRQVIFGLWTASFVRVTKMGVEVRGNPPRPPFFLVTNHLSYTDIAALRYAVKGIFVAKAEVRTWPLAGRICKDMGTIFINRTNRRDIPRAGEEILQRLSAGEGVIVFPEGTATSGQEGVLPFNSSFLEFAAQGNVAVSYASITYQTPEDELPAHLAAAWGEDISFIDHLWRLLKVKHYTAIITFGSSPISIPDRKQLASELHDRVADIFIPVA
jgi:1-acyl-sn-glycerol-3-phosphate acyltransferase